MNIKYIQVRIFDQNIFTHVANQQMHTDKICFVIILIFAFATIIRVTEKNTDNV